MGRVGCKGAVVTQCDRSRTEEVMGARNAMSSSLLGMEFATKLMELWICMIQLVSTSTLLSKVASALIEEQRRGSMTASSVENSLSRSELVGRGPALWTPNFLRVSSRKSFM